MSKLSEKAARNLKAVREKKPLVHNITNLVVMNYTANALLAMGASPVMAHAENEVEEMVSHAGSLVLNIGTLTDDTVVSMIKAGKKASIQKTPIILDPVGAGATSLRTVSAQKIIAETNISVIRGNASEILSLRHSDSKTKGVDSVHAVDDAAQTAKTLASELKTTLAITGPVDFITESNRVYRVSNGHPLMARVTGTGCTAALAYFGLAGEIAGESASAPGSFMIGMLDALYTITPDQLKEDCKIENG
ncbi:MAG: hydroxyethylthiazole kinase [Desulfosarcina sp.]|nr:hydroxyethylthiazole kinase [Desulfosarcina sp.]MBC2768284.1 hydroxyethylthiazole kinase [Desulfosarcina sp.]